MIFLFSSYNKKGIVIMDRLSKQLIMIANEIAKI